jgi:tetratricopeptide (TPR) repeat protein
VSVKRALKWLVIVSLVGALVLLGWRLISKRRAALSPVAPWSPSPASASESPAEAVAESALAVEEPSETAAEALTDVAEVPAEPVAQPIAGVEEPSEAAAEAPANVAEVPAEPVAEPIAAVKEPSEAAVEALADIAEAPVEPVAELTSPPPAVRLPVSETTPTEHPAALPELDRPEPEQGAAPTAEEQADFERAFESAVGSWSPEAIRPEASPLPGVEVPSPGAMGASPPPPPIAPATETPAPGAAESGLVESLEEALADLAPARIVPPPKSNAESYLDEGNVLFNVGQYERAIESYGRAIDLDPGIVAGYYNRANARTRAGDLEGALADYDLALEREPHDADALNNRGMLHLYRGNYAHALSDFDAAIALDPGDTTVLVNRGLAYLHGGDADRALADFRQAAGMDPSDPSAHYAAAQASAALGNRAETLRYIGRTLLIDPAYAREAAADSRLALVHGDPEFMRLLREAGSQQ